MSKIPYLYETMSIPISKLNSGEIANIVTKPGARLHSTVLLPPLPTPPKELIEKGENPPEPVVMFIFESLHPSARPPAKGSQN